MPNVIDLTGQKFGRLVVLGRKGSKNGKAAWECRCECGQIIVSRSCDLKQEKQTSCGCIKKEGTHKTHGKSKDRLYRIWRNMKTRCANENIKAYKDYGGRGIKVCDEWIDNFQSFYDWSMANGYSDRLTIERVNVNGNYEPSNCKWATMKDQQRNKTNNHLLTFNGDTLTLAEWSEVTGIHRATLKSRLDAGCTVGKTLTESVQRNADRLSFEKGAIC